MTVQSTRFEYGFLVSLRLPKSVCLLRPLDDWRRLGDPLPEDVSFDQVWKRHGQLIGDETFRWDREDLCERRQREARSDERSVTYGPTLPG